LKLSDVTIQLFIYMDYILESIQLNTCFILRLVSWIVYWIVSYGFRIGYCCGRRSQINFLAIVQGIKKAPHFWDASGYIVVG